MARKTQMMEDANLLRIIKEKADQYGEAELRKSDIALEYGISPTSIGKSMDRLKEKSYIDFEFMNRGRAGSFYRLWLVDQNKRQDVEAEPTEESPSEDGPVVKLRMCKRCGTVAASADARFCHRCGESLLTEEEQLKEQLDSLLPRVARSLTDASVSNELFQAIAKLRKLAFGEVTLSA